MALFHTVTNKKNVPLTSLGQGLENVSNKQIEERLVKSFS